MQMGSETLISSFNHVDCLTTTVVEAVRSGRAKTGFFMAPGDSVWTIQQTKTNKFCWLR